MEQYNVQLNELEEVGTYLKDGLVLYDLRSRQIQYTNSAVADLVGDYVNHFPKHDESMIELVVPEDREYLKNSFAQIFEKRAVQDIEVRLKRGEDKIHICCSAYLLSNNSTLLFYLRDITRTRAYENYLVEFGARKNTMLDTLTHNISGALALMQNLSQEAEKHLNDSGNSHLRTYISLLRENSKRSIEMINDLMKKEHVESPEILVKQTRIDVVDKIKIVHQELQHIYSHRKFLLIHDSKSIFTFTDDLKLLQVVNNYLSNAIKFSPPTEPIVIKIEETSDEVIISVEDRGIGIPDDLQPYIFDRTGKIGRTGLNGEKSVGLGLWICKNLIELMGGRVWFESEEGKGSTFCLSLPKLVD